ncbi:hypothetical protein [Bradyrhizobium algeriense]|nr:hypothetical protein [Bradyrhizobium algeriense]
MAKFDMKALRPSAANIRPRPVPLHDPEKWPPVFEKDHAQTRD